MTRPIRWLHLSDLHYGCAGKALWEQVEVDFFRDLDHHVDRLGPPDLLLFTGDLAFSGKQEEYKAVDAFLDELLSHLGRSGAPAPLIVPVPGNHDVAWPEGLQAALKYNILSSFDGTIDHPLVAAVSKELWKKPDASFIADLFPAYRSWFESRIRPQLEGGAKSIHFSHFPCDFTAVVEPAGAFPLTLVALNSTWLQYSNADFDGKLLIPIEQFSAALMPTKPYSFLGPERQALLLMHQPPEWLSKRGREIFDADVYPPGRFSLCLFGHKHEPMGKTEAVNGAEPRQFFQSPSLFGVEKWGQSTEDRRMGYTFGQITAEGEIRIWPRESRVRGGGNRSFGFDGLFHADRDDETSAVLRRPAPPAGPRTAQAPPAEPVPEATDAASLAAYLRELRGSVTHLELRGLAVDDQQKATKPTLDQLYTPLRGRDEGSLGSLMGGRHERPALETLLARGPRILIEGAPGSGKSTFLRRVTALLLVPALGERLDEGHSRFVDRLGIGRPIPVLLRLEGLGRALADAGKPSDRERLLDQLELDCRSKEVGFDREGWRRRLEDGRACLLLDGLDEVAAADRRAAVLAVLQDASEHWRARMVVASRPYLTEGLTAAGFVKLEVAPFEDDDIRCFLNKWAAMLDEEDPERAKTAEARKYRGKLEEAILRPDIRLLAKSPMMLTCLCLVHWSRGELPRGRARIYQAVIKWLLEARRDRRLERFRLSEAGAFEALADLALWAVDHANGKQVSFELAEAAVVVAPVFERIRGDLGAAGRRKEARRWLEFEAGLSGVLEEQGGGRLRFWHLTFGEYLAGWRLSQLPAGQDWWPRIENRLSDASWRETVELFASCLQLHSHASHADRLLDKVLRQRSEDGDLAQNARVMAILGRLLPALEIYDYKPTAVVREAFEGLRREAMAIFDREGAERVPIEDRIAAAEALGQGGDPRLRPEVNNFIEVQGQDIRLGKYPVTVEEYQRFVEARGYEDERWWSEGWAEKEEEGWESPGSWEEQLQTPNRPVVEVSWWEAMAYCQWLSDQRRCEIRLPTEAEWERAATHPEGPYPWGSEEPNEELANFDRSKIGRPPPVGVYPRGAGLHGHLDLAGNVWEWCLDDLDNGEARPLRGGSWLGGASDLRSAYRFRYWPGYRVDDFGFRVSWSPSSTDRG